MNNQKECEVPLCPALAEVNRSTCAIHRYAQIAGELHIIGSKCLNCHRSFAKMDWVYKSLRPLKTIKRSGERFGHEHVACEPTTPRQSRQEIRDSVKPLLEVADDITRDRGAA